MLRGVGVGGRGVVLGKDIEMPKSLRGGKYSQVDMVAFVVAEWL